MTDAPKRIRIDPDYNGWDSQVIGWDSDRRDDQGRHFAESDWPEYLRADLIDMDVLRRVEKILVYHLERARSGDGKYIPCSEFNIGLTENGITDLRAMMEKLK